MPWASASSARPGSMKSSGTSPNRGRQCCAMVAALQEQEGVDLHGYGAKEGAGHAVISRRTELRDRRRTGGWLVFSWLDRVRVRPPVRLAREWSASLLRWLGRVRRRRAAPASKCGATGRPLDQHRHRRSRHNAGAARASATSVTTTRLHGRRERGAPAGTTARLAVGDQSAVYGSQPARRRRRAAGPRACAASPRRARAPRAAAA